MRFTEQMINDERAALIFSATISNSNYLPKLFAMVKINFHAFNLTGFEVALTIFSGLRVDEMIAKKLR